MPGSVQLEEDVDMWQVHDSASNKSLVQDSGITVTQSWSQKWQKGDEESARKDRERQYGIELLNRKP